MTRPWLELPINKLGVNEKRKNQKKHFNDFDCKAN